MSRGKAEVPKKKSGMKRNSGITGKGGILGINVFFQFADLMSE
jgi:hypothetical protein